MKYMLLYSDLPKGWRMLRDLCLRTIW